MVCCMIKKIKELIMNLPVKTDVIVLCIIFIFVIFISKWYSSQSQTIAQTMVLHHEKGETE